MSTVSIVLRTRDRPILLARALCGILGQTHEDWRLILVNAGASGPVQALAETYATAFGDRLTLLHAPDTDPDQAAALGLARVGAAEWVALHDDDDAWHPDFLRAGLAGAAADQVAVACHGWRVEERMEADGVVEERREPGFSDPCPLELARLLGGPGVPPICLLMRGPVLDRLRRTGAIPGYDAAGLAAALLFAGEIGVVPRRLAFSYRRATRAGPYANRSNGIAGQDGIEATLRRNRLLREAASGRAGPAGIVPALEAALAPSLQAVQDRLERNGGWGHGRHADTQERLIRLEAAVAALLHRSQRTLEVLNAYGPMLRPLGQIWDALERPRRWLVRLRGRRR